MRKQKAVPYSTPRSVCCAAKAEGAFVKTAVLYRLGHVDAGLWLYPVQEEL
jgi:hypothetical protein